MKFLIVLALVGLTVALAHGYEYDQKVVDELLNNDRFLGGYANCLQGTGSCTKEGTGLKKNIPELIRTSCSECTETDKANAANVVQTLNKKFPEKYEAILKIYDPEGTKLSELEEFINKYAS